MKTLQRADTPLTREVDYRLSKWIIKKHRAAPGTSGCRGAVVSLQGHFIKGIEADTQSSGRIVIIKGMIPTGKQVDTGTGQSGWLLHRRNHKHSIRYIELILLLKNPLIKIYIRTRL